MTGHHHVHVFLHALSTRLSFWMNLTASYLEDLLTMEQQTDFTLELADVHAQGFPWLSMRDLVLKGSL